MALLKYKDQIIEVAAGTSVLDTLLDHGQDIPNSCRAGACQSCVMQVTRGNVPERAQRGLKDSHKLKGLFLACSCHPDEDIDICLPDNNQFKVPATVHKLIKRPGDVIELQLKTDQAFDFHAGQFVTLWRDKHLARSYSLTTIPQSDSLLTFHIKRIPGGAFSNWVHDELQEGDSLLVQGPAGDCFYVPGSAEQDL
jgi:ferredoxin